MKKFSHFLAVSLLGFAAVPFVLQHALGQSLTLRPSGQSSTVGGVPLNLTEFNLGSWQTEGEIFVIDGQALTLVGATFSPGNGPGDLTHLPGVGQGGTAITLSIQPMATESFPQTVPALPPDHVPASVSGLRQSTLGFQYPSTQAPRPSLAVARPDFQYVSSRREFEKVLGSSVTGQRDLGLGPGVPAGQQRFVPVGEY